MLEIKGVIPAMVTPFDEDEELNEGPLRELTNYLIDGGVHALFATGSQGEFYALTPPERKRVWEIVIDEVEGRVPVLAGTGANTTREVIELDAMAEDVGVDGISIIVPSFISPSQDELYEHFAQIAKATELPIILYNNPGRTGGLGFTVDLIKRLAMDFDNIVGIKDSSGDLSHTSEIIRVVRGGRPDFNVIMGRDTLIHACFCYGGQAAIAATGNVCPALVARIYDAYVSGDVAASLEAQTALAPLRVAFGWGTFPVVVKEAVRMVGIDAGPCRAPVGGMSVERRAALEQVVRNQGVYGAVA
jgi:4-hydroxy-tetrahydrodipicolinate synthase